MVHSYPRSILPISELGKLMLRMLNMALLGGFRVK